MKDPEEFKRLISPSSFLSIIEKNCSSGLYEDWEGKRKFITSSINISGSILDIGCAGGFFLRSLMEWSEYELIPYGIDIVPEYIKAAQELFPEYKDHFAILNLNKIDQLSSTTLPINYDFIYWSTSDRQDLTEPRVIETIKKLLTMTTHRLILGFYGTNKYSLDTFEYEKERERIRKQVELFTTLGFEKIGFSYNPTKFNNAIVWIDK